MDEKVFLSLVSVVVGWVLAQGTTLVKEWMGGCRHRRGLVTELGDIAEELRRMVMIYRKHLQMYAVGAMDASIPMPMSNLYFRQYYKDAIHRLNRAQRMSYQLIHNWVSSLNAQNEEFGASSDKLYRGLQGAGLDSVRKTIDAWGESIKPIYENARYLQWHIDYHLKHPRKPELEHGGDANIAYRKFAIALPKEIDQIVREAKAMGRQGVLNDHDKALLQSSNGWTTQKASGASSKS